MSTKSIDWSKAPEGATHARIDDPKHPFRKKDENGCWYAWVGESSGWVAVGSNRTDEIKYAPRTDVDADAWTGEGLPPVGTVCEWLQGSSHQWQRIQILAYHGRETWIQQEDATSTIVGNIANLRPLRTPEQIAADERLHKIRNAFTSISKAIKPFQGPCGNDAAIQAAVEAMIDAGYRKTEGGAA